MIARFSALVLLGGLLLPIPALAQQGSWTRDFRQAEPGATVASVRLRAGPGISHRIIATLPGGTRLVVLGRRGTWLQVRVTTAGGEGFVSGEYVQFANEVSVPRFLIHDPALRSVPLSPSVRRRPPAGAASDAQTAARAWNNYGGLLKQLSERIDVAPEVGIAVLSAESQAKPFDPHGRLAIRFENHIFWDHWGERGANRGRYNDHFRFSRQTGQRYRDHHFRASRQQQFAPFHDDQDGEWRAFRFARELDARAAHLSISMGLAQVMGFNHTDIGYSNVTSMMESFSAPQGGERAQIIGMFDFVRSRKLVGALQRQDWDAFARGYNGKSNVPQYSKRLKLYYQAAKSLVPA